LIAAAPNSDRFELLSLRGTRGSDANLVLKAGELGPPTSAALQSSFAAVFQVGRGSDERR
jgi:hypothetical protein